jgi:hypothetical protein
MVNELTTLVDRLETLESTRVLYSISEQQSSCRPIDVPLDALGFPSAFGDYSTTSKIESKQDLPVTPTGVSGLLAFLTAVIVGLFSIREPDLAATSQFRIPARCDLSPWHSKFLKQSKEAPSPDLSQLDQVKDLVDEIIYILHPLTALNEGKKRNYSRRLRTYLVALTDIVTQIDALLDSSDSPPKGQKLDCDEQVNHEAPAPPLSSEAPVAAANSSFGMNLLSRKQNQGRKTYGCGSGNDSQGILTGNSGRKVYSYGGGGICFQKQPSAQEHQEESPQYEQDRKFHAEGNAFF